MPGTGHCRNSAAALALASAICAAAPAITDQANIKSMSLQTGATNAEIRVISTDGVKMG